MRTQQYPRDRFRIVIIADNCTDESAKRAMACGADDVYVRQNTARQGKGYALDEILQNNLRHATFDRLLLFDIDALVDEMYLARASSYPFVVPTVYQGSTVSKNPNESRLTRVGDLIQSLVRLYQEGRSRVSLPPLLIGSHGLVIDRAALDQLDWRIAPKGMDGDDLELGLRCALLGVRMQYAPELRVVNDLPAGGQTIRQQRRRWTRSVLRLIPSYAPALLLRGLSGDWRTWDMLIGVLLLPSFSNLFLLLAAFAGALGLACAFGAPLQAQAITGAALWGCDVLYLLLTLFRADAGMRFGDILGISWYLAVRVVALVESVFLVRSKEWWPTPHRASSFVRADERRLG